MTTSANRLAVMTGMALSVVLISTAAAAQGGQGTAGDLLIHAEKVYVRPGEVLSQTSILVSDGVIAAMGPGLSAPEGVREISGRVVCAGFMDPWSIFGVEGESAADDGTDFDSRTVDGLDPYVDARLRRELLHSGITLLRVQAGSAARTGGIGAVVRNHPGKPLAEATLLDDACVAASLGLSRNGRGVDPFDQIGDVDRLVGQIADGEKYAQDLALYRRDLVEWEEKIAEAQKKLEDDFKKAKKDRDKEKAAAEEKGKEFKEEKYKEDKQPKPPKYDSEKAILARVANGELPLIVQVHRAAELRALLEGTARFDRLRMIIAGGTEADSVAEQLAERRIAVIIDPSPQGSGRADEYHRHDLSLAGRLAQAGVQVLLGSGGRTQAASRDLPLLAAIAVGHGLEREAALEALTIGAARALDVADRVGTLERGKDADLLVLDGEPLESATRVRFVISAGEVVVSPEDR